MAFTRQTWRPRELSCWLRRWFISGNLAIWTVNVLEKVLFQRFWVPREINSRFRSKTLWQMTDVCVDILKPSLDGHQHGVSIQISINLGNKFLRISRLRKAVVTWILASRGGSESLHIYVLSFPRFWTLIYFEWRDTKNHWAVSRCWVRFKKICSIRSIAIRHCCVNQYGTTFFCQIPTCNYCDSFCPLFYSLAN